jgi:hypothetical protein
VCPPFHSKNETDYLVTAIEVLLTEFMNVARNNTHQYPLKELHYQFLSYAFVKNPGLDVRSAQQAYDSYLAQQKVFRGENVERFAISVSDYARSLFAFIAGWARRARRVGIHSV